jgi:hypothetical protein
MLLLMTGLGILVPLVERARDVEKDRIVTTQRLRQCSQAVHAFHDTFRRLPDAFAPGGSYLKPKSYWFHLLPYVDAAEDYRAGRDAAVVTAFQAPQDDFSAGTAGRLSFAVNLRIAAYMDVTPATANKTGVAFPVPPAGTVLRSNLNLPRIVDGTANTILLATRRARCDGKDNLFAADPASFGGYFGAGSHSDAPSPQSKDGLMFQNAPPTAKGRDSCNPLAGVYGHAFSEAGLLTALAEGSVKLIRPSISNTTFMRALTPCDQLPLGADWAVD